MCLLYSVLLEHRAEDVYFGEAYKNLDFRKCGGKSWTLRHDPIRRILSAACGRGLQQRAHHRSLARKNIYFTMPTMYSNSM
jgi:hypothetical protein